MRRAALGLRIGGRFACALSKTTRPVSCADMAVQIARLASTAKTAKPVNGRTMRSKVAKVGATPWKTPKNRVSHRSGIRSPGRPNA